jgi:hypothetical protein
VDKFVTYMIKEQPEMTLLLIGLVFTGLMIGVCGEVFVS